MILDEATRSDCIQDLRRNTLTIWMKMVRGCDTRKEKVKSLPRESGGKSLVFNTAGFRWHSQWEISSHVLSWSWGFLRIWSSFPKVLSLRTALVVDKVKIPKETKEASVCTWPCGGFLHVKGTRRQGGLGKGKPLARFHFMSLVSPNFTHKLITNGEVHFTAINCSLFLYWVEKF